ncbi:unnamed protein product [Chilo suppressalis]|uniref:DUF4795 domain-containing protein n=1 Tax=Chilo suppressalis TaxID=168631 RepID=A0ABN8BGX0_CHISP|nr:unnamed protein product [Chilo suppressalis]
MEISTTLMSIKQMIDTAFGDPCHNVVNHKLVHAILIILARQIRLLERHVEVEIGPLPETVSATSLNITEVKMVANVPKKKKQKLAVPKGGGSKSPSDRTSTGKSSSGKTSTEQSTSDKTKTSSSKQVSSESQKPLKSASGTGFPQKYLTLLDKIEEQRERELRVIHQRADSREEHKNQPTPIASMDSMEKQYEKLLVVERVPTDQAKLTDGRSKLRRLSVVTQEEFAELAVAVKRLQEQYIPAGNVDFPNNAQLLNELRKGASLTDAMAALQLSARLEAAEKTLEKMISLVTDLASNTTTIKPQAKTETLSKAGKGVETKTEVIFEADEAVPHISTVTKKRTTSAKSKKSLVDSTAATTASRVQNETLGLGTETLEKDKTDWITAEELDNVMQELHDEFLKIITTNMTKSNINANNALKIATRLESKLDESLDLGDRMNDLEILVSDYAEHINTLDTGISAQMTNYQEQLTQMQHDLEAGIETMQEALANTGGDTAAVAELNSNFSNLQVEFDFAAMRQKELSDIQDTMAIDLKSLWKQIEILRDQKSDRDEVADALRDKAGIAALNGLVSRPEFDAVRGDFEKRIGSAYDKFNSQEVVWQKAIDELLRELNEKADWLQVVSLQESITKYLEKFNNKIKAMTEIVGEPRAAAVSRKLHRDAACLSCNTPAHMDTEENDIGPSFPAFPPTRPTTIGAESNIKPSEDGDHEDYCFPGFPIPHPIDPRSHVCRRFCGGSHTMLNNAKGRIPPGMIINPLSQEADTEVGTDGKAYFVDHVIKPCKACYQPKKLPISKEAEPAPIITADQRSSDMTPPDYRMSTFSDSLQPIGTQEASEMSATPPPPIEDD